MYAPADDAKRVAFMRKLDSASWLTKRSHICTDANCVPSPALDLRREATSPYNNAGADILAAITNKYDLHDEIRLSLGLDFDFTHSRSTTSNLADGTTIQQVSLTRIDQMFCPVVTDAHWTCTIDETIYAPNTGAHKTIIGVLEFKDEDVNLRSELTSIDPSVLEEPNTRSKVNELINTFEPLFTDQGSDFFKHWKRFKFELRAILKKATRAKRLFNQQQATRLRIELNSITAELKAAVADPHRKAASVLERKNKRLNALRDLRVSRNEGSGKLAYSSYRREEQMSRQYFCRAFSSQRSQSFINALNDVNDWDDPPDKNEELRDRTKDCAAAAAKYYSHLSKLPEWESN